jgi:hypothetical protein
MTAITALVLSCISLIWQVLNSCLMNRPSMRMLLTDLAIDRKFSIEFVNQGTGSASVQSCVTKDGKDLLDALRHVIDQLKDSGAIFTYHFQQRSPGFSIAAGESWTPIRIDFEGELPSEILDLVSGEIRISYRSIYGIAHQRIFKSRAMV